MIDSELYFIKLGGSLITDKAHPLTARPDVIKRLAAEIAQITHEKPDLKLLIGHGSGSFGHAVADRYQMQTGVMGKPSWKGFAEVWAAARQLNQLVINAFVNERLPVIAFPPSAGVIASNHSVQSWDVAPLIEALSHHLIPVVQGDVIFDRETGGTIFSTEKIFSYLAKILQPKRILLAGLDPGVHQGQNKSGEVVKHISSQKMAQILPALSGAENPDVTGGMASKVKLMADLVQECPDIEILIFSGMTSGNIQKAVMGESPGTMITF